MKNLLKTITHYFKNNRQNEPYELTWDEAKEKQKEPNAILIDVRSLQEYEEKHIDGAICLPYYEIQAKAEKMLSKKDDLIILYCQTGIRSKKAYNILKEMGYTNLYHIKDGLNGK